MTSLLTRATPAISADLFHAVPLDILDPFLYAEHGDYHGLGHGVGLEVHEEPGLGRTGTAPLVAGDVIAIEPGTSRGGEAARVEDLVLVTEDAAENLTRYPYGLTP